MIVVDLGKQWVLGPDGARFAYVVLLGCGCRVELDVRHVLLALNARSLTDAWADLLATHQCQPPLLDAARQKALPEGSGEGS